MTFKLVVDFEATCSKDQTEFPRESMEIIEIGACILDENGETRDTYQAFVRPVKNPKLTDFCKELTTITQEQVDLADVFEVVVPKFQKWVDDVVGRNDYTFYSWGNFDKNILKRQCDELNVSGIKMIHKHVNAKAVFAKENRLKREVGVGKALGIKKMSFEGTPHRADSDAYNIARLIKTIS